MFGKITRRCSLVVTVLNHRCLDSWFCRCPTARALFSISPSREITESGCLFNFYPLYLDRFSAHLTSHGVSSILLECGSPEQKQFPVTLNPFLDNSLRLFVFLVFILSLLMIKEMSKIIHDRDDLSHIREERSGCRHCGPGNYITLDTLWGTPKVHWWTPK